MRPAKSVRQVSKARSPSGGRRWRSDISSTTARSNRCSAAHEDGDLGIQDADGFVRVTGRRKDLIIRGGVNIAPLEINEILIKLHSIAEAAAVGVPDKIYGEEVVCYVVPRTRR